MSVLHYCRPGSKRRALAGDIPRWITNNARARYILSAVLSYPLWVTSKDFEPLIEQRNRLTEETGIKHVFAHIVPLNHSMVCGLTVPWNIEVKTWKHNAAESNHFMPDQLPLFEDT